MKEIVGKTQRKLTMFWYGGIFLLAVSIFLVHYIVSGQAVYGDGIGYFAHLHSWVIDGDWNYTNEYMHLYDSEHNNTNTVSEAVAVQIVSVTKNGNAENFYGTGVAIILLPFYLFAHLVSILLNYMGVSVATNGYADIYQIFTGIGAISYTVLGLVFLDKTINNFIKNWWLSLLSSVTTFFATSLLYYGSFDVINSHFASFFLSSLFFYLFICFKNEDRNNLLLGIVAGTLFINRMQDAVVALIWLIDYFKSSLSFKAIRNFTTGIVFASIPLIIQWSNLFENIFEHPYLRGVFEKYEVSTTTNFWGSLFDPVTGFFIRTPLILVLFLYFIYLLLRKRSTHLLYPFIFFVFQFVIISVQGGWSAAAFGGRMYMSSLVFFGLILGELFAVLNKAGIRYVYTTIIFFSLLNFVSMGYFVLRDKGTEGGKYGTEQKTILRIKNLLN